MRLFRIRTRFSGIGLAAWAAGLLVLGGAERAGAQPRGDAIFWAEERYERWGPFGSVRNWEGGKVHGEGRFFPINGGAWAFWLDASERGQELRFQGNEIPTDAGRLSLQLGDYVAEDYRRDALRLEFQQPVWLRGAAARLDRQKFGVGVRMGTVTDRRGLFAWGRRPAGGEDIGLTVSGLWKKHGLWKVDWDRQEALDDRTPGKHLAQFFVGMDPAEGWSWMGQARLSRQDVVGRWGNSLIAGGGYKRSSFVANGHLRRISPSFQSLGLGRDAHRNEWGGRVEGAYRPRPRTIVGTSFDLARSLTAEDPYPRETRFFARFYGAAPIVGPFAYQGSVSYRNRSTPDPDSLLVDQGTIAWNSSVSWLSSAAQAEIGYNRSLYRDRTLTAGDWHEDRFMGNYQQRLSETLRAEFRGWWVKRRFLDGGFASVEKNAQTRLNWEPRSHQRGWISFGRDVQDAADAGYSRDQWEVGTGWVQPLPWDLALSAESLFFLRAGALAADRARFNFRLARRFSLGAGQLRYAENRPEFGEISGQVFEDLNANGFFDPGEPGIPGILLRLGSGVETETDGNGFYRFTQAATVFESVSLDVARLPTRYLAPEESRHTLRMAPGDKIGVNYPVQLSAALYGRVMVDLGHRSKGAADVLIKVQGTHHDAFTDSEGRFFIPGLAAGTVTLEVVEWSLPRNTRPQVSPTKTVVLTPGKPVNAGVLVLDKVEPKLLQIYRPEPDSAPGSGNNR